MKSGFYPIVVAILAMTTLQTIQTTAYGQNKRDTLEGLVFETEEWSEPKDAWLIDKSSADKWQLWSKEDKVEQKRSMGRSLVSPTVKEDRATAEDGAPPLHTKITGIPNGTYEVRTNSNGRPIALSWDGKEWFPNRDASLGVFTVTDGTFEIWADDRYANPANIGSVYYDYLQFIKIDPPKLTGAAAYTRPDGSTQISWISSTRLTPAIVVCETSGAEDAVEVEAEGGLRNHFVVFKGLEKGKSYKANIVVANLPKSVLADPARARLAGLKGISTSFEFVAGATAVPPATVTDEIKLAVAENTDAGRENWPVTSGVPFAEGRLASSKDVVLLDGAGKEVPAQFETFARWNDGSVKWLICDFAANTKAKTPAEYRLATGKKAKPADPAKTKELEARAKKLLDACLSTVVLGDGTTLVSAKAEAPVVESSGPVRVSLRADGDYLKSDKTPMFRWRCHVTAYADGLCRVRWAIGNNMIDDVMTPVRKADWTLRDARQYRAPVMTDGTAAKRDLAVLQDLEKHSFVTVDGKENQSNKLDGLFICGDNAIKASDFWQTWPKGFEFRNGRFRYEILPQLRNTGYPPSNWETPDELFRHFYWYKDGCYQFKRGLEICSEVWLIDDAKLTKDAKRLGAWLETPLFAVAPSDYYCATKAFGNINPRRPGVFESYEKAFDESFANFLKGREIRGEYGWMNFGDWYGERSWNWGNNEYDLPYLMAIQFARTGNLAFVKRGLEMAKHYTSVDFCKWHWRPDARELVYAHSTGHIGGFLDKEDPRLAELMKGKFVANLVGGQDGSGGHAFHPGNFYFGCLTGEKYLLEVAETACRNQAMRYTPAYQISIERAAGWALSNAVYAYNFTQDPYYLNAAKLYFEAVVATQNPETGCFDLRQDQSECDCPDKKEHRGGKAFAVGVLLHALARYYETSGDPAVKTSITRCADWLLDYSWNEKAGGFRYKTGCPKYANTGWYSVIVSEGIAYATEVSGNPRYIDFLDRTAGKQIVKPTGSGTGCGKTFTQFHRHLPHLLYYLEKNGKNAGIQ